MCLMEHVVFFFYRFDKRFLRKERKEKGSAANSEVVSSDICELHFLPVTNAYLLFRNISQNSVTEESE